MDENVRAIIQQAQLNDPDAWQRIAEALFRSTIYPKYFYFLTIYMGSTCRECNQPIYAEDILDINGRELTVLVDSTGGDACDTPSGSHEPVIDSGRDQVTHYFTSKKRALQYLINKATQDLIANGDDDLVDDSSPRNTILGWKQIFDPDYEIRRLKFTE